MKFLCALLLLSASLAWMGLTSGDVAPDFSAKNQDEKVVSLSKLKGAPVLLFFYPKDDTPGCTQEACSFRDHYAKFKSLGVTVLGISKQDAKSHREFREKHHLPFDLLTDTGGKVAQAFGVKEMPIIGYHHRQSVLIGADGKVIRFYPDVNPATHTQEVLKDLQK